MFPATLSRVQRESFRSLTRAALAMVLIGGLCILALPTLAQAADNGTPAAYNVTATLPGSTSNPTAETPSTRWTLLPDNFAQATPTQVADVPEPAFASATPGPVTAAANLYAAPAMTMNANGNSESGGHGHWLAPIIVGGILAGAGTYITVRAHNANCSNIQASEGQTICGDIKTGGLVMIPVGAALVGLGLFLRLR